MSNQVKVTAEPESGQVVIASENSPEYGYVRVEQETTTMENGWLRNETRSALIRGTLVELEQAGFEEGQKMTGKIIAQEQTEPFYDGQEPKINPSTGEVLYKDGEPIYRQTVFTQDLKKADSLIQHDSVSSQETEEEQEELEESITG